MAGQVDVYRKEIFNFLRTVTIKFEPFAYRMGSDYMEANGLTNPHAAWNPYYINLCGGYTSNDTFMTVRSVETGELVPFDINLATNYPRTAKLYRVPNQEYFTLQELYPKNKGLVQSIVYPASSIEEAIAAPNLSLLAYDSSILESPEREDIVKCLKDFLAEVKQRWWVDDFDYEDMYSMTFWCMLWQMLPVVLLTRRFSNIRTPYTHSFHVWEYLKNKGLNDYRDVLTTKQAFWLYRNLGYVLKNQGKNDTLEKLVENLLPGLSVSLLYKEMWQETATRMDSDLITNPQFRSFNLLTHEWVKTEGFDTLNSKIHNLDLEKYNTADYIEETEKELGTQPNNILPTKFLEFKKDPKDTRNEQLMINFLIESMLYRIQHKKLSFDCSFVYPHSGAIAKMDPEDLILLMNYAAYRSVNQFPEVLPSAYIYRYPFVDDWDHSNVKNTISYGQGSYKIDQWVDVKSTRNSIEWLGSSGYRSASENLLNLMKQFKALLKINDQYENSNSLLQHKALDAFLDGTRIHGESDLTWNNKWTNYVDWIAADTNISSLIKEYEDYSSPKTKSEAYQNLVSLCYNALFPFDELDPDDALYQEQSTEKIYTAVRDLFISLGSYNVVYLETDRDKCWNLKIRDPDYVLNVETDYTFNNIFYIIQEDYEYDFHTVWDPAIGSIYHDLNLSLGTFDVTGMLNLQFESKFDMKYSWSREMHCTEEFETSIDKHKIHLTIELQTDPLC